MKFQSFGHLHLLLNALLLCANSVLAQEHATGLKLSTKEELKGIPLASTPYAENELPTERDLSAKFPVPGNHGHQQSCVAWTLAYALKSYQENIEGTTQYGDPMNPRPESVFSPSFIYSQINNGVDGGAIFSDGLNILSEHGAVSLKDMPYSDQDFLTRPNEAQFKKAKRFRIDIWRQVNIADQKEVKAQLAAGIPVAIGARIDESFIQHHGSAVYSGGGGASRGGHAMLVVGYSDTKGAFRLINSWGATWGDKGFAWVSYQMFKTMVNEGYVAKDAASGTDQNPDDAKLVKDVIPDDAKTPLPKPLVDDNSNVKPNSENVGVQVTGTAVGLHPQFGKGLQIVGIVAVPPGIGKQLELITKVYYLNPQGKRVPVPSLSPQFALPNGQAASSAGKVNVFGNGFYNTWQVFIPEQILNLQAGFQLGFNQAINYTLLIEPELFIDSFGVGRGQVIQCPFSK